MLHVLVDQSVVPSSLPTRAFLNCSTLRMYSAPFLWLRLHRRGCHGPTRATKIVKRRAYIRRLRRDRAEAEKGLAEMES